MIDDNAAILGFVQMALEDEGYAVSTAENGAVARWLTAPVCAGPPAAFPRG